MKDKNFNYLWAQMISKQILEECQDAFFTTRADSKMWAYFK